MRTTRAARRTLGVIAASAIASLALAGAAFGATVHGADYYGTGSALESGEIDVLQVDGSAGETVFLTVMANGQPIAKNLPYTIGEGASADDGDSWAGIATLDIDGLDLNALDGSYTIEAYANRAGGELLYQGAIYGVYADLPDGSAKLIGTRTANEAEAQGRAFEPAETLYDNGLTYRLAGEATGSTVLHFPYVEYDESKTVDGVIKYTDATGATVATTKIPGLGYGEKRNVSIPGVITADNGDVYRTVFFKGSVVAENPGRTSFSIYCTKMSDADQAQAGFYVATIQMVDQTGKVIASDSVNVTGEFTYTAPASIYKTEVVDSETGQTAVVSYVLNASSTIHLSAADDGVLDRTRTVTVSYTAQPLDSAEVTVTFNLLDGSKRVNEEGRTIEVRQAVASEDKPTVEPPSTVEADGVSYHLVGDPEDYSYTLRSGEVPTIDAYYVPDGYEAPGAYDVTVNYVNFLTNETIESHSYTSDPYQEARIAIDTPAEFSANGVDYVRLAGQEDAIRHSYYSGITSYVVYYRDVNDELSAGVVINNIRVVYGDGSTSGGDATAAGASDAQAMQLNGSRTYNVLDGDGGTSMLTNESGVDSNTERIEDSETPLASGFDKGGSSTAASSLTEMSGLLVPVGIGAVVVIAVAVTALVVLRRREENDDYEL